MPSSDIQNKMTYSVQMLTSGLEAKMNWNQTSSYDTPGMVVYDKNESSSYI